MAEGSNTTLGSILEKLAEIDRSLEEERRTIERAQTAIDERRRAKAAAVNPDRPPD